MLPTPCRRSIRHLLVHVFHDVLRGEGRRNKIPGRVRAARQAPWRTPSSREVGACAVGTWAGVLGQVQGAWLVCVWQCVAVCGSVCGSVRVSACLALCAGRIALPVIHAWMCAHVLLQMGVLQYVVVRLACTLLTFILVFTKKYCNGALTNFSCGYIYITFFVNCSQVWYVQGWICGLGGSGSRLDRRCLHPAHQGHVLLGTVLPCNVPRPGAAAPVPQVPVHQGRRLLFVLAGGRHRRHGEAGVDPRHAHVHHR